MKKIPLRMCICCREMKHKEDLIRIVKTTDCVVVNAGNKVQGRGYYICKNNDCLASAKKKKVFERTIENLPKDFYDEVAKAVDGK